MEAVKMEKQWKRIFHVAERLARGIVDMCIYAILWLSLLSFPVCLIVHCKKYPEVFSVKEIAWFFPGAALLWLIGRMSKALSRRGERVTVGAMMLMQGAIAAIMILSYPTEPCSDYGPIWQAAQEMARGEFVSGLDPTQYMYYFNWQLGIAAFESLVVRLGGSFFTLKIICAMCLMGIQYMEYRIVKRKWGALAATYAYVLATLFMPWFLTIPQFTNHHIGLVLLLMVFELIERRTAKSWLCAGALLAVQNLMRPLGIIVILSLICMTVYMIFRERKKKTVLLLAMTLISYTACTTTLDQWFIRQCYTDAPVSQARLPYFKFQKGLYDYQVPMNDLQEYQYDYEAYNTAMKEELLTKISSDPIETAVFVANKMCRYLGLFDYQFEMTYNHDVAFYTKYPVKALYSISWMQYIGTAMLALIGYRTYRLRKQVDIYQVFFVGNTLVYFFIEAFSSYRFESYPMLIMLAALGYERLEELKSQSKH